MANTFTGMGDALMTSVSSALALFFLAIPRIIGFLVILIIGWMIASLVAKGIAAFLRKVNFDNFAARSGLTDFVRGMGVETDASGLIALIAKWFIRIIALVVAFDALGLPAVSDVLREFLAWIPNLVVALVVLVIGGIAASTVAGLVRGAANKAGLTNAESLAKVGRIAVWAFAIVIAVNQIGIAATLVNTLFTAVVGAVALALGLAFGLGGKDTASRVVSRWYRKGQEAESHIERAMTVGAGPLERVRYNQPPGEPH